MFFYIDHEKTGSAFRMFRNNTLRKHLNNEHVFSPLPAGIQKLTGTGAAISPNTVNVKYSDHVKEKEVMTFKLPPKKLRKLYSKLPEVD